MFRPRPHARRPGLGRPARAILVLTVALAGCATAATPAPPGSGASSGPTAAVATAASAAAGSPPASGGGTVEGSLTTSGALDGTWTWSSPDSVNSASPPQASLAFTIRSATGAYGNVEVKADGSITFTSGKLPQGPFAGKGGTLMMGAGGYPCAMSIDATLTGGGGATLKVSGTLTAKGHLIKEILNLPLDC
jgi:hypothetical protein